MKLISIKYVQGCEELIQRKTTIYDIAEYCKVSPATVSRVLSRSKYPVSEEVRTKVQNAADELKYVQNLIGKNLKTAQNNDIGVVIPNMSYYYSILLQAIQDVALEHNSQIILCNSYRDAKTEEINVNFLLQKQIKGILIATIDDKGEILQRIIDNNVPVVAMEQDVKADCPRTYFNFDAGVTVALDHLLGQGHRDIAFVSAPLQRKSRKDLLNGYKMSLMSNNIEINNQYIYIDPEEKDNDGFYDFTVGKQAADYFLSLKNPPTAVFCINDMIAIGMIKQLQYHNISVPGEIAVVGFDNIPFTEMMTPTITTIDQSTYDLGHLSADLLFKNVSPPKSTSLVNVSIRLEPKLIVRESTTGRERL